MVQAYPHRIPLLLSMVRRSIPSSHTIAPQHGEAQHTLISHHCSSAWCRVLLRGPRNGHAPQHRMQSKAVRITTAFPQCSVHGMLASAFRHFGCTGIVLELRPLASCAMQSHPLCFSACGRDAAFLLSVLSRGVTHCDICAFAATRATCVMCRRVACACVLCRRVACACVLCSCVSCACVLCRRVSRACVLCRRVACACFMCRRVACASVLCRRVACACVMCRRVACAFVFCRCVACACVLCKCVSCACVMCRRVACACVMCRRVAVCERAAYACGLWRHASPLLTAAAFSQHSHLFG